MDYCVISGNSLISLKVPDTRKGEKEGMST